MYVIKNPLHREKRPREEKKNKNNQMQMQMQKQNAYHIGERMRGISNDGSAAGQVTSDSFSDSQSNIRCKTQSENVLTLLARPLQGAMVVVMIIMGMPKMPPLEDLGIWRI